MKQNSEEQFIGVKYGFESCVWSYQGPGSWFFVSLPAELALEIREKFKCEEEGWGRLKANAKVGNTICKTAIWFDTKKNTYILPLKAEIRNKEQIAEGDKVNCYIWL